MYCWNCGEKLNDSAKFCRKCGADQTKPQQPENFDEMCPDETIILPEDAEISSETAEMSPDPSEIPFRNAEMPSENEGTDAGNDGMAQKNGGKLRDKGMMGLTVAAGAAVAAAVFAVILFVQSGVEANRLEEYMDIGYSFMEDGNYEEAAAAFESALGVDPKSKEAQEMLTQAYRAADSSELEMASAAGGPDDTQNIMDYVENPESNSGSEGTNSSGSDNNTDVSSNNNNSNSSNNNKNNSTDNKTTDNSKNTDDSKTTDNSKTTGDSKTTDGSKNTDDSNYDGGNNVEDSNGSKTAEVIKEYVTPDPEPVKEDLQVVNISAEEEEDVKNLIQTFSVSTIGLLEDWYDDSTDSGDYFEYEAFDAGQPYAIAALSLVQTYDDDIYDADEEYVYYDTQMCSVRDLTVQQLEDAGDEIYVCMDDSVQEAYGICVYNLFGDEYPLEEFAEYDYEGDLGVVVRQDDEGQLYLKVLEEIAENPEVEVEIEQIVAAEDDSEAAGTYGVLAMLTETDNPNNIYHIRCWVDPDDTSSYGYAIKKIVPAGEGENPDLEFVVEEPEEEAEIVEEEIFSEVGEDNIYIELPPPEEPDDEDSDMTEEIEEQPDEEIDDADGSEDEDETVEEI